MSKEKDEKMAAGKSKKKQGRISKWFKDLRSEFKKVTWPTRKKVVNNTFVVVVTMVFSSVFVGLLDTGLLKLFSWILNLDLN